MHRVVRREAILIGAAVAALIGLGLALGAARNGSGYLFNSDAIYSRRIARDPFGDGGTFAGFDPDVAFAYRYGRILYPLLSWKLALGRPSLVVWTMPVVYALSIGVLVACACELVARAGRQPLHGALVLVAPAFWLTLPIVFGDALFVALILATYLMDARGGVAGRSVVASLALLARETALIGMIPLIVRDARARNARACVGWAASLLPLLAWWAWVRVRLGTWPPLDRGGSGTLETLSLTPLGGFARVLDEGKAVRGFFLLAIVLGVATILFAAAVWWRRRREPAATAGLLFAALLVFLGPAATRLPAQTVRLMLPAQVLAGVALLRSRAGSADDHPGTAARGDRVRGSDA